MSPGTVMTKTLILTIAVGAAQFEVASVKPNTSPIAKSAIQMQPGGRFTATNVTLPYQTLIASLLHKYASGRLKEV